MQFKILPIDPFNNYIEAYRVPSYNSRGFSYVVALNDKGQWTCSCPAWVYSKTKEHCKHVKRVLNFRKEFRIPEPVLLLPAKNTRFSVMDV